MSNESANGSTAVDRLATLERELVQEQRARRALAASSVRLNSLLNLPDLLDAILAATTDLVDAESGALMLLDEGTFELTFEVATGATATAVQGLRIPADQGIAGWVLTHDQPAIVNDASTDSRLYARVDQTTGFTTRSLLAVPLKRRDVPIGVVEAMNKRGDRGFTAWDQELAVALAAQAAVAIDNARLYQKLADALVTSRMSYRL